MKLILPDQLLFGYWASAPFPWLIIVAKSQKDNAALIKHEQCHQAQQRRDGWLTFWWRYLTSEAHRLNYEVEAYKVWLDVKPEDESKVIFWLTTKYKLNIKPKDVSELLGLSL